MINSNYAFYYDKGHVALSVGDKDNVLRFSSRNEINAFINEVTQFRDNAFPKVNIPPMTWDWVETKWGTNFSYEESSNRKFMIEHRGIEAGALTYSLWVRNRSYDPYKSERREEWAQLGEPSTKVLNLKAIADLMNQESQAK